MNNKDLEKIHLGDVDLDKEEESLATELKQLCDDDGKEIDPTQSSPIFHKLAQVYQQRKPEFLPDRMICLVKSAALFNAAIARSPENVQEIETNLKDFCTNVLHEANAKQQDADLVKQGNVVTGKVNQMRVKVEAQLKKIFIFPETTHSAERNFLQNKKVIQMEKLQNGIANDLKNIMAGIAKFSEKVLGEPPCKFSLTGMGSLAKDEATPYSDFENMIILDPEVSEHESTLNYFRWFSVIFQIVLINLQETIIPSVSIFSLNDPNSNYGNWFYDKVTTRGLCFDGMMPHACKFPLGRQQLTKAKPWKTELIKPANEMLKYLNTEESLKNGYHLSTILTKTCHVYGNIKVFKHFEKGVQDMIEAQKDEILEESVKNQITEDLRNFATRQSLAKIDSSKQFNLKQIIYRSSTILISELGRLYKIRANSCFEILRQLAVKKQISENAKNHLMFAVALACELRLRWYMMMKRQNDSIDTITKIFELIGKQATLRYFQITYALQCDISKRLKLKKLHLYSDPQLLNISIAHCISDNDLLQKLYPAVNLEHASNERYYDFDECLCSMEKDSLEQHKDNLIQKIRQPQQNSIKGHMEALGEILIRFKC